MDFYPPDVPVPGEKRTERLYLRPLSATDVALDYDAVMSSKEQLRRWSQTDWPADDFTLDQNREDLQRHEDEHDQRQAFTFTVLNPPGTRCLGCVYIIPIVPNPTQTCADATYAANVGFWVRSAELANNLDRHLLATLGEWFASEWPFDCLTFLVGRQETRQAAIMREAGFEEQASFDLPDGRPVRLYGQQA